RPPEAAAGDGPAFRARGASRTARSESLEEIVLHRDGIRMRRRVAREGARLAAEVQTARVRSEVRRRLVGVHEVERRAEPPLPSEDEVDVQPRLPIVELVGRWFVTERRAQSGEPDRGRAWPDGGQERHA